MSEGDWASASAPGQKPKIESIFDFSAEALGQLKVWLEQSGLTLPASSVAGTGSQTYTPVWGSQGVQPAIGNGVFNIARYSRSGKTMSVTVKLTLGSTSTFGTGNYTISLPIATTSDAGTSIIGTFQIYDASAASVWTGTCQVYNDGSGCNKVVLIFTAAAGNYAVGPTVPFTFAQNDEIKISVVYQTE